MKSHVYLILGALALTLAVGCSSKKKSEDDGLNGEGADIVEQPLSFDPMGSDSGTIAGLSTVYFEYDSATLTESAKQSLSANAQWLASNANASMSIEGHTDTRGSNEYNLTLGERRAQQVKNYLEQMGVSPARLSVISYGEEKLMSMGDNNSDHAKNRRANFVPR